ncbi:MAG: hypothetical protein EPN37_10300 [Chitinophagaceae bacterium]|nr:MAG: hypothetical protein EPN37_10300 [Chitinophagaceae bacterium]
MSYLKILKAQHITDRQRILELLTWDELQYGEFQMKMGEAWLRHYLGNDAYGIEYLVKDRMFWKWWINQWNHRDESFLTYAASLTYSARINKYEYLHSPKLLHARPHSCVLEESYARMIGELLDNKNKFDDTI